MTARPRASLDLFERFRNSRTFSGLTDTVLAQLVGVSSLRQVPNKSPFWVQSDQAQTIQFLVQGRAKVCYATHEGKQPILYFANAGELVGEQAILTGVHGEEYVEAMEICTVASIPTSALRDLTLSDADFAIGLTELISRRRTLVEKRIRSLLFLSNRERLTHLLLDLAEQYGVQTPAGVELNVKLSHQDFANFIGSTRETVTVVLGKMQADGLLTIRRRRVALLQPEEMARSVSRSFRAAR